MLPDNCLDCGADAEEYCDFCAEPYCNGCIKAHAWSHETTDDLLQE